MNLDGKPDILVPNYFDNNVTVLLNTTYQTPVGANSIVVVNNTTLTFDGVTTGGTTTVTPIDPASVGEALPFPTPSRMRSARVQPSPVR